MKNMIILVLTVAVVILGYREYERSQMSHTEVILNEVSSGAEEITDGIMMIVNDIWD